MACPAADLAASDAKVFVAYGTADPQINAGAVEEIAVRRMAAGKVTRMRRIGGGNHTLGHPDDPTPYATLIEVLTEAVAWLGESDGSGA